ncbi:MAG TPA: cyclic nucleotide-binding domain-containing protein [Candidatus Polarisedimenticolaceae bacterium]|jgi:CRP-like cAMP-binding protein
MTGGALGRLYGDGEAIVRQGEVGDCMYVVLMGTVEVLREEGARTVRIAELGPGEMFGEMALCEKQPRSATVRAIGEVRALTVDKRTFLRRVQEDPSLAFNVLKALSSRIRTLDIEVARLRERLRAADPES